MLPESTLSNSSVAASFLTLPRTTSDVDYEWGGVHLRDTSQGLQKYMWRSEYMDNLITLHNGVDEGVSVIQSTDISHHSFAFDQNMNPCIVYNKAGTTYCYWYDPVKGEQTTMEFDVYMESPQVSLDDHRHQLGSSDIILSYTREDKLCYRQQRDRYQIEYILGDARNQKLTQIGMSKNNRFQFRLVFDWRNE